MRRPEQFERGMVGQHTVGAHGRRDEVAVGLKAVHVDPRRDRRIHPMGD